MVKAVTDFEEKMNDLRQNIRDGNPIDENFAISRKKELDSDLYDKVNFSDFEIFSFLMNLNSNGLRRIAELKTLHSNNQYNMIDTVFENAISVPILWIKRENDLKFKLQSDSRAKQRVMIFSIVSVFEAELWEVPRIPTVKVKIPGKAFLKSESRTSVTFKL